MLFLFLKIIFMIRFLDFKLYLKFNQILINFAIKSIYEDILFQIKTISLEKVFFLILIHLIYFEVMLNYF